MTSLIKEDIIRTDCHAEENINLEMINKMSDISVFVSTYTCLDIDMDHFD